MKSFLFLGILKFYILENKCVGEALISPFLLIFTHFCHIGPSSCWLIFWATIILCTSKEPIFHENLGYTEWQKKFIVKNLKKLKFIILIYFSIVHIDAIYSKNFDCKVPYLHVVQFSQFLMLCVAFDPKYENFASPIQIFNVWNFGQPYCIMK